LDMWLTSGEFTEIFEKKISKFLNIRHCLFVNSGSSANLLALSSLKILYNLNEGDEVITSAVNFPTTVNPIIQNGLKPVFVDADSRTYNIDANLIESAITEKTKGIVLAHTLGNPFEINKIKQLCEKHNLFLMEDMCDAFGSKYDGNYVGSFGDVSTLSFYPAHHITTGEGGAVLTNNPKLKKIIESLRDWGRDCYCPPGKDNTCKKRFDWQLGGLPHGYDHKYIYSHIGYNLKATDMQAAIGVSQIEKLPQFIKARKNNFNYLFDNLKDYEMFDMPESEEKADVSWFGFPITINQKANFSRGQLIEELSSNNIGTRFLFGGNILLQPAYIDLELGNSDDYPVANNVVNNTFWIGVYPGLTIEMLDFVIKTI
ncbi:lipopolysaccharide biosynthesis protein RfbH, partial [archaeon]|nr:lipopolysaccharide biosynthesis protein RfbH [archaeon]